MKNPKRILITGGSAGIGEALATAYADDGVFIAISGLDPDRTEAVGNRLRAKGASVDARVIDVTDEAAMAAWIKEIDADGPLELVVANAGVGYGSTENMSVHERALATFKINVTGVFNTIHPALECMKQHGRGQIAVVSSIAGFVGLPGNPAYSASKSAVRTYAESLRGTYAHKGIEVNAICPGYVVSRLTAQNKFKMPFLMSAEKSARIIKRGLEKNKGRIGYPLPMYSLVRFAQAIPYTWAEKLMRAMAPKRKGRD